MTTTTTADFDSILWAPRPLLPGLDGDELRSLEDIRDPEARAAWGEYLAEEDAALDAFLAEPDPRSTSLEALLAAGFDLIPLRPRQKSPRDLAWPRRVYHPDDLRAWVRDGCNIGVRLGRDRLVLDHDPRNDPAGDSLIRFAAKGGIDLATTPITDTPTGGCHVSLGVPVGTKVHSIAREYPGIDLKRIGGYVPIRNATRTPDDTHVVDVCG